LPVTERPFLAADAIVVPYAGTQFGFHFPQAALDRSKADARRLARGIIGRLRKEPDAFERERAAHCKLPIDLCEGATGEYAGRGLVPLQASIAVVGIGDLVSEPVDSPLGYLVVQRLDPVKVSAPSLPEPDFDFAHAREFTLLGTP
jgi:hypothetical protein